MEEYEKKELMEALLLIPMVVIMFGAAILNAYTFQMISAFVFTIAICMSGVTLISHTKNFDEKNYNYQLKLFYSYILVITIISISLRYFI